jgi:hypothetical protein
LHEAEIDPVVGRFGNHVPGLSDHHINFDERPLGKSPRGGARDKRRRERRDGCDRNPALPTLAEIRQAIMKNLDLCEKPG